jgi:hypothetical protein
MSVLRYCWCAPRIGPGGTCLVAVSGAAGVICSIWDGRRDRVHFFELRLVEVPKLQIDNREIIAARLTSPSELHSMVLTGPVAAYLGRLPASRPAATQSRPEAE